MGWESSGLRQERAGMHGTLRGGRGQEEAAQDERASAQGDVRRVCVFVEGRDQSVASLPAQRVRSQQHSRTGCALQREMMRAHPQGLVAATSPPQRTMLLG
jgi:hypothetical protein